MAMGTERSKALHNFTMPCELRWGNQRMLRCMKVNSAAQISASRRAAAADCYNSSDQRHRGNSVQQPRTSRDGERWREREPSSEFLHGSRKVGLAQPPAADGGRRFGHDDDGIAAMREKVLFDLQTAADKMKDAIFKDGINEGEVSGSPPPPPPVAPAEGEVSRPWNLRTRRAACKTPVSRFVSSKNGASTAAASGENESSIGKPLTVDLMKPNSRFSPMRAGSAAAADKSPRVKSGGGGDGAAAGEKRERPKFSVALSRKEIEEDFLELVNHRPPRRPKKRARAIQRQLDALFPGLWLTEVTPDMYKVPEAAP